MHKQTSYCSGCKRNTPSLIHVHLSDSCEIRDSIKLKKKNKDNKIVSEHFSGYQSSHKYPEGVSKIRVIDRENNMYQEEVRIWGTNEVVYFKEEPLDQHQGHGSAKFKKDN